MAVFEGKRCKPQWMDIAFWRQTDRLTDKQTDKQMDSSDALSRSRYREPQLNNGCK